MAINCTDGQRGFILCVFSENASITKLVAEDLSLHLFGIDVKKLNKMQVSSLIEALLIKAGKPAPRQTRWQQQPTTQATWITLVDSPPERREQVLITALQTTVSAFRLWLFLQCRLKFCFRYVFKLKKPKAASLYLGPFAWDVLLKLRVFQRRPPLALTYAAAHPHTSYNETSHAHLQPAAAVHAGHVSRLVLRRSATLATRSGAGVSGQDQHFQCSYLGTMYRGLALAN